MRLKVLISAYACSPYQGSEPASSWGLIKSLSRNCDLWVIVESEKFEKEINFWLKENPTAVDNVNFFFIRKKRNRALRVVWPPSYYWYYKVWQKDAFKLAKQLDKKHNFDIVHNLTMSGFREPGYLWKIEKKPFVWGPIGGMGFFPSMLLTSFGVKVFIYYLSYNIINFLQMKYSSRPKLAAMKAGIGLVCANKENQLGAEKFWNVHSKVISEVGLPDSLSRNRTFGRRNSGDPLKLIWVGQMIPRKGLMLALDALATLPEAISWQLTVIGGGPLQHKLQKTVKKLKLSKKVNFCGKVNRSSVLTEMLRSHVFLQTSMRDLTSTVLIEALASGLPVLSFPYGGFKDIINKDNGILLEAKNYQQMVVSLADGISFMYNNEDIRLEMAQQALMDAQEFSWEAKAGKFIDIYNNLILKKQDIFSK